MQTAYKILRYTEGSVRQGLFHSYLKNRAYLDNDWASHQDTRKLITEYCVFLVQSLISRNPKNNQLSPNLLQRIHIKMWQQQDWKNNVEIYWNNNVEISVGRFEVKYDETTTLYYDNNVALHIAANPIYHERTK